MEKYSNHNYAQSEKLKELVAKNKIHQDEADSIRTIKKEGTIVLQYMEELAECFAKIYKLETGRALKRTGSNKFVKQNNQAPTGCVVRSYLWYQLIDKTNSNDAYSLSIFVEKDQKGKQRVRVCIERDNKKGNNGISDKRYEELKNINRMDNLEFVAGSNEKNNILTIKDTQNTNQKVQLSKTIERNDSLNNSEYTNELISGLKRLIHYYEYVIGVSDELGLINDEQDRLSKEEIKSMNVNKNISLNTILYGPPGTGKTYYTKIYALAICCDEFNGDIEEVKKLDYKKEIVPKYDALVKEGRIAFTTFHQSYGYEEFIEGIKPLIKNDESKDVYYDIKPGVFKEFCDNNNKAAKDVEASGVDISAPIWKMSLYGGKTDILQECFDENYLRIGFDLNSTDSSMKIFRDEMHKGDIVLSLASFYEINGIAIIEDEDIVELQGKTEFKIARKVKWIFKNRVINIKEINGGNRLAIRTCSGLPNINRTELFKLMNKEGENNTTVEPKPCVFIIDEINRGNISKIFGELITLIETTKREGMPEAMQCTLPYSKEKFSVPSNIYILGTMNTADRSIALMDTALRRRFEFIEMMPDLSILPNSEICGVNLQKMLDAMNSRIEALYAREHTIGHSFFMDLNANSTVKDFYKIFKNKIIPLLQEYFYEDYKKIRLVLGDNDKNKPEANQFVKEIPFNTSIFKGNVSKDDFSDYRYEINDVAFNDIESYKLIY